MLYENSYCQLGLRLNQVSALQYVLRHLGTLTPIPSKCVKYIFKKFLAFALPSMNFDYVFKLVLETFGTNNISFPNASLVYLVMQ
jgi:hypothetical protein